MRTKNHIYRAIEDPIGGVCGTVIEYFIYCFVRAFVGGGLFASNGTKDDK